MLPILFETETAAAVMQQYYRDLSEMGAELAKVPQGRLNELSSFQLLVDPLPPEGPP